MYAWAHLQPKKSCIIISPSMKPIVALITLNHELVRMVWLPTYAVNFFIRTVCANFFSIFLSSKRHFPEQNHRHTRQSIKIGRVVLVMQWLLDACCTNKRATIKLWKKKRKHKKKTCLMHSSHQIARVRQKMTAYIKLENHQSSLNSVRYSYLIRQSSSD